MNGFRALQEGTKPNSDAVIGDEANVSIYQLAARVRGLPILRPSWVESL